MIDTFQAWFLTLGSAGQTFWAIALIASAVLLVQALLTMIGMDVHADMDVDIPDGDTMDAGGAVSLFSIRSLVNFFVGFGWAGVTFVGTMPLWLTYVVAVIVGVLFAYMYIFMRRKLKGLERNGAFRVSDCVGKEADVYLRIPAAGQGRGKVQASINGSVHEIDAVSQGPAIATGQRVSITSAEGTLLTVAPVQ